MFCVAVRTKPYIIILYILRVPFAVGRVHADSNRIITDDFYAN